MVIYFPSARQGLVSGSAGGLLLYLRGKPAAARIDEWYMCTYERSCRGTLNERMVCVRACMVHLSGSRQSHWVASSVFPRCDVDVRYKIDSLYSNKLQIG